MATDQRMDQVSAAVHQRALGLFSETMAGATDSADADIQAAAINGLNGAVAQLMWRGRDDHATPASIADAIRFAAHDLLLQMQKREHN